jgi:RNA polymerase sigma-70 factor, ECF subfamily
VSADKEARLRRLWQEHRPAVAAYALRRTSSPEDAAEVVADTFTVAWQRLDDVPSGREARLWLYATARNVLANQRRGQRRRRQLVERLGQELGRTLAADSPLDEEAIMARRHLDSLGEAEREILMLAAWEGLSAVDLGRVLGCSAIAARIRLHRARSVLTRQSLVQDASPKQTGSTGHGSNEAALE